MTLTELPEMVDVFAELYADCRSRRERCALLLRSLFALPRVALLERLEPIVVSPAQTTRQPIHFDPNARTATKESSMRRFLHDLVFAQRTLRRSPGFTLGAVLLLALGVGAVTTIFTLFDNILLRPLPYPEEHRIVTIDQGSHTGPFWNALQDNETAELWATSFSLQQNLIGEGEPRTMNVSMVNEDFFRLFGGTATLGRLLAPDDYDSADRVVLSYETWQRIFGLDDAVLGQTVQLGEEPAEIVGVLERGFSAPEALTGAQVDFWRPIPWSLEDLESPGFHVLEIAALLAPGTSIEAFQAEVQADVVRLDSQEDYRNFRSREGELWQAPVSLLRDTTVRGVRTGLQLLFGAVGVLLLIACANVAHLSLARGLARGEEMTVRRALGAKTATLVRQLLAESLMLSTVGGLLGVGLAAIALQLFLAMSPEALPRGAELVLDLRVAAFAIAVASVTGVAFGLLPALQTVGRTTARQGQRTSSQDRRAAILRNTLMVTEVALSLILLVAAAVLLRSFFTVSQQEVGFSTERVWRIPLQPPESEDGASYVQAMGEIQDALRSVPGVASATYGLSLPFSWVGGNRCCWATGLSLPGDAENRETFMMHPVADDYFTTLGIDVRLGALWRGPSSESATPAALPESTASSVFGSPEAALGKRLIPRGSLGEIEVVAVVADVRHYGLDQSLAKSLYLPMDKIAFGVDLADFAVRSAGPPPAGFERSLRNAIWSVAPDLPVEAVTPMEARIRDSTSVRRFESLLFTLFGVTALILAAAGLYGTLLYNVGARRREMGIRIALGAEGGRIAQLVVRSGLVVIGAGVLLGVAGSWVGMRLLESRLWGVDARDATAMAAATAALLAVGLAATWLPARRASRTNPVEALRAE